MLFNVTWDFIATSVESSRQSLAVFAQWQRPAGAPFQGFFAGGFGGVAILEADSVALTPTTAPLTPWLRSMVTPTMSIEEHSAIAGEAVALRDVVK